MGCLRISCRDSLGWAAGFPLAPYLRGPPPPFSCSPAANLVWSTLPTCARLQTRTYSTLSAVVEWGISIFILVARVHISLGRAYLDFARQVRGRMIGRHAATTRVSTPRIVTDTSRRSVEKNFSTFAAMTG